MTDKELEKDMEIIREMTLALVKALHPWEHLDTAYGMHAALNILTSLAIDAKLSEEALHHAVNICHQQVMERKNYIESMYKGLH